MKKKLGPLETWQWLAIGLAAGIVFYIYRARQQAAATAASTGASPAQASDTTSLGPVDPTTGQPYALEALGNQSNGTAAQNSGPTSLQQELSDLQAVETLLSGLQSLIPTGNQNSTGNQGQDDLSKFMGQVAAEMTAQEKAAEAAAKAQAAIEKQIKNLTKKVGTITTKPATNPGHTVTKNPGGITHSGTLTASSSAPHNTQQHKNIAPPTHQRHPSTAWGHPSFGGLRG